MRGSFTFVVTEIEYRNKQAEKMLDNFIKNNIGLATNFIAFQTFMVDIECLYKNITPHLENLTENEQIIVATKLETKDKILDIIHGLM